MRSSMCMYCACVHDQKKGRRKTQSSAACLLVSSQEHHSGATRAGKKMQGERTCVCTLLTIQSYLGINNEDVPTSNYRNEPGLGMVLIAVVFARPLSRDRSPSTRGGPFPTVDHAAEASRPFFEYQYTRKRGGGGRGRGLEGKGGKALDIYIRYQHRGVLKRSGSATPSGPPRQRCCD